MTILYKLFLKVTSIRLITNLFSLSIEGDRTPNCPVRLLAEYIYLRKYCDGPLYLLENGRPVDRKYFNSKLSYILNFCGYEDQKIHIRSHSFRIGAATLAIENGYSYEQVELMGRWNS